MCYLPLTKIMAQKQLVDPCILYSSFAAHDNFCNKIDFELILLYMLLVAQKNVFTG